MFGSRKSWLGVTMLVLPLVVVPSPTAATPTPATPSAAATTVTLLTGEVVAHVSRPDGAPVTKPAAAV